MMGDTIYLTLFVPINVVNNMQYLQLSNRSYTCSKFIFTFIFFSPRKHANAMLPFPLPFLLHSHHCSPQWVQKLGVSKAYLYGVTIHQ